MKYSHIVFLKGIVLGMILMLLWVTLNPLVRYHSSLINLASLSLIGLAILYYWYCRRKYYRQDQERTNYDSY